MTNNWNVFSAGMRFVGAALRMLVLLYIGFVINHLGVSLFFLVLGLTGFEDVRTWFGVVLLSWRMRDLHDDP